MIVKKNADLLSPPLAQERQAIIRMRLQTTGRVLAGDLAREFATSEDTIRRDLRLMADAGICRRVYGGALPLSPASGPLRAREAEGRDRKAMLAAAAARLVLPGQFVMLDAGSTNLAIARALPDAMRLTVATNALGIAVVIEGKPNIDLVVLGGRYDRASGGNIGAAALRAAEALRPDLYFVGACALDPVVGLSVFDEEEAELKRVLVAGSAAVAVALTDEKFGTAAPHRVSPWDALDHLIVETPGSLPEQLGHGGKPSPAIHVAASRKTAR